MKKVDFFIVGQAKSGTTALADFLGQHPEICISFPKEPAYFATDIIAESDRYHGKPTYFKTRTPEQYEKVFNRSRPEQILGEASTSYIYSKEAARNIFKYNPQAKIIVMFRNPADFLHSLHMQYVNETVENEKDFSKALGLGARRKKLESLSARVKAPSLLFYMERINYYSQLKRYYDLFPKKQILVIPHDDFVRNNKRIYKKIIEFLGVKDIDFVANFSVVHGSKKSRNALLNNILHAPIFKNLVHKTLGTKRYMKLRQKTMPLLMKKSKRDVMSSKTLSKINKAAYPEIKKLHKLTGIDFVTIWKLKDKS